MADVGRLTATIDVLRRKGLSKSRITDQLVGAYCPMVAQESALPDAEKPRVFGASLARSLTWSTA